MEKQDYNSKNITKKEKVIKILGKTYWQKNPTGRPKTTTWLSVTLSDVNSQSEVRTNSTYLIKSNKITVEEQDKDKLGKLLNKNNW